MDSSVSPKEEICFLRVCRHISTGLYQQTVTHDVYVLLFSLNDAARVQDIPKTDANHTLDSPIFHLRVLRVRKVTLNVKCHFSNKCCVIVRFVIAVVFNKLIRVEFMFLSKCKAVPLQAWSSPEGSRKLRFPDFMTTAQDGGKVVSLTHRPPLPPGNTPGTHFC